MKPYYTDDLVTLYHGDCREVMRALSDASVDAVVTDPPYGLGFMGKEWDDLPPGEEWARECLRVLKPGGHLLAFGGTRTWHRLACAIEDAGFEMRDTIAWVYASGFPKSLDVSKAIDKAAGAAREVVGQHVQATGDRASREDYRMGWQHELTTPATEDAQRWQGWGTALKPAHEPIVVARKPLAGQVALNVLAYGTGALNIDGARVPHNEPPGKPQRGMAGRNGGQYGSGGTPSYRERETDAASPAGRWPSNLVLSHAPDCGEACKPGCLVAELDAQSGVTVSAVGRPRGADPGNGWGMRATGAEYADSGGASRFFPVFRYEAKAATTERPKADGVAHPTVKPLDLMRWLVRLVTPLGGTVLDPFAGSGTTAEACVVEGFRCIAIEREADYLPLTEARLAAVQPVLNLDGGAA